MASLASIASMLGAVIDGFSAYQMTRDQTICSNETIGHFKDFKYFYPATYCGRNEAVFEILVASCVLCCVSSLLCFTFSVSACCLSCANQPKPESEVYAENHGESKTDGGKKILVPASVFFYDVPTP